MSARFCIAVGALLGAIGVAAGAGAVHLLKEHYHYDAAHLEYFETAVRYCMFHALALVAVGLWTASAGRRTWAGCFFLAGCVLFSGCLATFAITDFKPLVHVVPVGGLCLIVGWLLLAVAAMRHGVGSPAERS